MNTKTLTFRRAAASDLDAVTAIYDKIHAQEDAGRVTIGWVTGVYPTRLDAELAFGGTICMSARRKAALRRQAFSIRSRWMSTQRAVGPTCRFRPVRAGDWPRVCAIL